ncbi:MAG: hypothetical protein FJ221_00775 [Lentisphaerae bacterium]|nr:hypothetical protein [Lentisphaerota bacterium]
MKPILIFLAALLLAPLAVQSAVEKATASQAKFSGHPVGSKIADPRDFENGWPKPSIPKEGYVDQPYVVVTKEGHWVCLLTTGPGEEGDTGQHIIATISKDKGQTWSAPVDIEPGDGPAASWVVPLITPSGRIYAIYSYNGDHIFTKKENGRVVNITRNGKDVRSDMFGWKVFKYSDDGGLTWSARHRIPMRVTAIDRANPFMVSARGGQRTADAAEVQKTWDTTEGARDILRLGETQMGWGIDKPIIVGKDVLFGHSKWGDKPDPSGRSGDGWLFRSSNLLHERDPEKIHWEMLPDGDHGIRAEEFGGIQEEHNIVPLSGDGLYCIYRTKNGFPCHSYSRDGGRTWTKPERASYSPGGRTIRHPRACPMLWKTANGRFLLWYHNNGTPFQHDMTIRRLAEPVNNRNLGWLTAGEERDGFIHWSQPELINYNPKNRGCSYPDLIEDQGRYFFISTQKVSARVQEIAPALIDGLWQQNKIKSVAESGLVLSAARNALSASPINMPHLPSLAGGGGYTVETWLKLSDLAPGQILLDSRDEQGKGIVLSTADKARLEFAMSDGQNSVRWDTDPNMLKPGILHHVVFIIDGGPKLISVVVDGLLCDGGNDPDRPYGYGRFLKGLSDDLKEDIADTTGAPNLRVGPMIQRVRLYDRYLRTTEAIGNYRAGCSTNP